MTDIESIQPRHQFAASAFAFLVGLSLISTLAWNINVGHGRPPVHDVSAPEARAMLDAGAIAIDVRDKATAASAHVPSALLSRAGFAKVVNLRDGFESWRSAGLPTASDG